MATTTTTTTTTATVTVGGGTTVDNLNVLDTSKTNDLSGMEVITWTEVSAALFGTKLSTQSQTLLDSFNAGSLKLTFAVNSDFYTIYRDASTGNYRIEHTSSDLGLYSSTQGDLAANSVPYTTYTTFSDFLTAANTLISLTSLLTSADIDGGVSKDNIQGIASN